MKQAGNEQNVEQHELNEKYKAFGVIRRMLLSPLNIMLIMGTVVLAAMMMLMTADVFGRYLFKSPISGADEVIGFLLLCLTAFSIAYSLKEKMHIRIDFIVARFPLTIRAVLDVLAYFAGLAITVLIAWQVFVGAWNYILNPRSTEVIHLPYYPFLLILGIGFTMFALMFLAELLEAIKGLFNR